MRKILSLLLGVVVGAAVGAVLITLFSPVSGEEFRKNLSGHYQGAIKSGQDAAAKRRAELEAELQKLRNS